MIKQKKNHWGGGLIPLLFKLHQIKKEHKTLTKFRKILELARKDLALIPLENYPDFNEALWIKTQLTYRLGKVLIECDKAKFKGGYLHFFKKITEAKKDFYAFRQSQLYLIKNKLKFENEKDFDVFLNSYFKLDNLLFLAKDYQALLHTLIFNFTFVMKHLEPIETWLRSEEFKTRYIRTKHPYPPLLNPRILNELLEFGSKIKALNLKSKETLKEELKEALNKVSLNELSYEARVYIKNELDYRLIDANLAWDLNLGLPNIYGFVMFLYSSSAHWTLISFFEKILKIDFCVLQHSVEILPNLNHFYGNLNHKDLAVYSRWFMNYNENYKKHYLSSHLPFIILVRCPISRLKTLVNHGSFKFDFQATQSDFNLGDDIDKVLDRKVFHGGSATPNLDFIPFAVAMSEENFSYTSTAEICQDKVHYIDSSEIDPQNVMQTMRKYAVFFNKNLDEENLAKNEAYLREKKWSELAYLIPLTLNIAFKDKVLKIEICLRQQNNHIDFSKELLEKNYDILKLVALAMNKEEFDFLASCSIFNEVQLYLNEFILKLEAKWKGYLNSYAKEEDVLLYFKNHRNLALSFKKILDKELSHIKEHRPDIVASWKYYAKFEKICEALMKERV
ncbi:putative sugar transferase [Campylobacter jejuni subsp. doylei]|nr:putative sugar transferase [Campylobacter jejuni subsp. doylei]